MKTPNKVLMSQARESLKGKWGKAVIATVITTIIQIAASSVPKIGSLVSFVIGGPMALGIALFWLSFSRNQNPEINTLFEGFKTWLRTLGAYLLVMIYTLLWTLLLIIPGIIASFAYSQTFFILAEDKTIGIDDAITKSKKMMKGNKEKLFFLGLRFIGWGLLCVLTLGIGFLWLVPYVKVSLAKFYEDIKTPLVSKTPTESVEAI